MKRRPILMLVCVTAWLAAQAPKASAEADRPWAVWKPWTLAGSGVLVTGVGFWLNARAISNADRYDEEIASACADGCPPGMIPESTRDLESTAKLQGGLGIGALVVGGAAIATGVTWILINRPAPTGPVQRSALVPRLVPGGFQLALRHTF